MRSNELNLNLIYSVFKFYRERKTGRDAKMMRFIREISRTCIINYASHFLCEVRFNTFLDDLLCFMNVRKREFKFIKMKCSLLLLIFRFRLFFQTKESYFHDEMLDFFFLIQNSFFNYSQLRFANKELKILCECLNNIVPTAQKFESGNLNTF